MYFFESAQGSWVSAFGVRTVGSRDDDAQNLGHAAGLHKRIPTKM